MTHEYKIFVTAIDNSQWGEGWLEKVEASNRHKAKHLAIEQVRLAIQQPGAELIAHEYP